jgi:hypothetical protein
MKNPKRLLAKMFTTLISRERKDSPIVSSQVQSTWASGEEASETERVCRAGQMEPDMKEIGKRTEHKAKDCLIMSMEISMKANG